MDSNYEYETYTLDNSDNESVDKDIYPNEINYLNYNLSSIIEENMENIMIPYSKFKKKNEYTSEFYYFLIYNVEHFNKNYRIKIDESKTSLLAVLLSNMYINEHYKKYLDLYLSKTDFTTDNELKLIYMNIICYNNLEIFKYLDSYYPVINLIKKDNVKLAFHYNSIEYNIVNHSLSTSSDISEYIIENNKFNVFNYLYVHIFFNMPITCSTQTLTHYISNTDVNNSKFYLFIQNSGYYKQYDTLIDAIIFKLNDYHIFNEYIHYSINNIQYYKIKQLFKKRELLIPYFNHTKILEDIVNLCNEKITSNHKCDYDIIQIWVLLFPYIEKYAKDNLEHYFSNLIELNNIVTLRNAKIILKKIDKYVLNWNKRDYANFTPILDCVRYGSYDTVKYMFTNYDLDLLITTNDDLDILSCALYNCDIRILKYIKNVIINNNELSYYLQGIHQSIYINIISYNKFIKKKLSILYEIFGYLDLDYAYNKYFNNINVLTYLIKTYNYKIKLNNINIHVKTYNFVCDDFNKLKIIFDNIDFSDISYDILIEYICRIGCINLIFKVYNYIFCSMLNIIKINKDNVYSIIFSTYNDLLHNKCPCCCKLNKQKLFTKYIQFISKTFINNNESLQGHYEYFSYPYLIDEYPFLNQLYINGIYPKNILYNQLSIDCYSFNMLRLIYYNKKYNNLVTKWNIVIYVLKQYVRKRFKSFKLNHSSNQYIVNNEIKFKSTTIFNSIKPKHIHPLDCINIHEQYNQISLKADGVYKKGLFNIFPNIEEKLDIDLIEYEYMKDTNMCYIFNYKNNPYDFILKLRMIHPFISNDTYPPLNLSNYYEVLLNYSTLEKLLLKNFITKYKSKKKWWAKYIFKLDKMCYEDYLLLLDKLNALQLDCFNNDGWILIDAEYKHLLKLKPLNHLTIDLKYRNNKMCDQSGKDYPFETSTQLENNHIYRCYYKNNCWNPSEIRYDKFKPNTKQICEYIETCHKYPWSLLDMLKLTPYYHKNKYNSIQTIRYNNYKKYIQSHNVLNLGCGFSNKYVGIDIDPKVLTNNKYIIDLSKDFQLEMGNIYHYFPNINDFNKKYNNSKFDVLLSDNSIHYFTNTIFFRNINNYVEKNTKFIVTFLNKELLLAILDNNTYISNNSSFIRIHEHKLNLKIKVYYEWCHTKPIIENVYSKDELTTLFKNNGWKLTSYDNQHLNKGYASDWELYFKCFSTLVFMKT